MQAIVKKYLIQMLILMFIPLPFYIAAYLTKELYIKLSFLARLRKMKLTTLGGCTLTIYLVATFLKSYTSSFPYYLHAVWPSAGLYSPLASTFVISFCI